MFKLTDSDEEMPCSTKKKRIRIIADSDSDSETSGNKSMSNGNQNNRKKARLLDSESEHSDCEEKNSQNKVKSFSFQKSAPSEGVTAVLKDTSTIPQSQKIETFAINVDSNWRHNKLEFLKPNKIRDINIRRPDDPDYDERTLYVPEDFLNTQTPAMRQWWILKSKHFDSVLFFKVGKFYEFYHMDAVIGVNYLGFSYMKGDFAHSGFPESAYGRMAASLIEQGFKVARVEQTETPDMMNERCKGKKSGKFDKVVNREICQISMKGTCVYGAQMQEAKQAAPCYMLAISEKVKFLTLNYC